MPKKHYIYIITHPMFEGWIKVGRTIRPKEKLAEHNACVPDRAYRLEFVAETNKPSLIKKQFERRMIGYVWGYGYAWGWFKCDVQKAIRTITLLISGAAKKKEEFHFKQVTDKSDQFQNLYAGIADISYEKLIS